MSLFFIEANFFTRENIHVPSGGNTWVRNGKTAKIMDRGITSRSDENERTETYVRFNKSGKARIFCKGREWREGNKISVSG